MLLQLIVEIRRDVLATFAQARESKRPQIDSRQQVVAKTARLRRGLQIAIAAGDQLKIALRFAGPSPSA